MARRRMIDPNFWQSEDISRLSPFARLLFIGMISNADDEGRGRANTNYLKSTIFPYDDIRVAEVDKALSEISHNTSVVVYEVAHSRYYAFTNWKKWQRVDKPQDSIIPPFEEHSENDSRVIPESVENDSGLKEKKRKEEKRKEINDHFEVFWNEYPRKVAKKKAESVFLKMDVSSETFNQMLTALRKQKAKWKDPKYIPHPTTWLNQERWNDEDEQEKVKDYGVQNLPGITRL